MAPGAGRPLVVCYGNPLRSDDGVGWAVADRLMATGGPDLGADVIRCHQLVPELALDVSRAERVIVIDSGAYGIPGTVETRPVEAAPMRAAFTHSLSPATLAALAAWLYESTPPMVAITVAAASFDAGEHLSPAVAAALPAAVDAVIDLLPSHGGRKSFEKGPFGGRRPAC